MASTVLAAALFALRSRPSRFCPDAALSFSAPILPASSGMRYLRRSLAATRLQGLRRPQGSQWFELQSAGGGAAPFVSTSSMPP
jgi:hypothetical protein